MIVEDKVGLLDIKTRFVILVPFYNAEKSIGRVIESAASQTSGDWTLVLLDDGSKDKSYEAALEAATKFNLKPLEDIFYLRNEKNLDIMQNVIKGMKKIPDECIVGICDGDDFLYPNAVQTMLEHYAAYGLDFAWSNFTLYPSLNRGWCREVNDQISPRVFHPFFWMSHFRTWKAGLFKQIPDSKFRDFNGNYYGPANDVAIMFSLWDQTDKYMYVDETLYYHDVSETDNTTRSGDKRAKQLMEEFQIRCQLEPEDMLVAQNYYKHVIVFFEAAMDACENDPKFAELLKEKGLIK
jgi:glycosyltransferase involved in cell wall biosynthesis